MIRNKQEYLLKALMKKMLPPSAARLLFSAAHLLLLAAISAFGAISPVMAGESPRPISMTTEAAMSENPAQPEKPSQHSGTLDQGTLTGTAQAALPRTFSTSFQRIGNSQVPFVSVVLDDGKDYLFALDPGTANTSIDRSVAAATGLPFETVDIPKGIQINTLTSTAVLGSSRLKLSEVLFVVEDLRAYRSLYPGFAGIIGASLLRQFTERLDFTAGKVDFILPSDSAVAFPESRAAKGIALAREKGTYGVSATVDGNAAVFSLSLLYDSTVIHNSNLLARLKPEATLGGLPAGDGTPVRFLRLGKLSVGDKKWDNPVIEQPLAKAMPAINILGLDFLRRFYLTLDLGHQQIYLNPDPAFQADPHEWEGLGIVPAKTAEGKLVIAAIGDPSPARAAGLKVGDEVMAIQSMPTAQLSQEQEAALVKRPIGTPIEITVQSGGNSNPRKVYLKVKKLL